MMKQTEIGLIPDDWEVKRLGDVAFLKSGKTIDFSATKEGIYPCYGGNGIRAYIPFYSHDGAFPIIGRQGELCGNVQYADGKFYATEHAVVCTPNNNVDSKWLYFQLIKADINKYKTGNAQPGISVDKINSEVFIPFPPIAEQQRIAKALSDVDAVISTTEKLIQKKKNIKQGTMQNLLTGKKRLPGFGSQTKSPSYKQTELGPIPEDWEVKRLEEIEIKNGEMLKSDEYKEGTIPVIAGGKKPAGYHNRYNRKGNTITISGSGANAGFVSFYEQPIFASDCSTINEQKNIQIEYLFYSLILKQEDIYNCQTGGAQPHIHAKDIKDLFVLIPKNEKEQIAIAKVLSSMDKEIETLNTKLEKYRNLKTAMMQQLLTGKIRLR